MQGKVAILAPKSQETQKIKENPDFFCENPTKSPKFKRFFRVMSPIFAIMQRKTEDFAGILGENAVSRYIIAKILQSGDSFGEIPENSAKTRGFCAICAENCVLLTISAENYRKLLRNLANLKENREKAFIYEHFFKKIVRFDKWRLQKYGFFFRKSRFSMNSLIFAEGDPSSELFLVKSGEIELFSANFSRNPQEIPSKIARISIGQLFGEECVLQVTKRCVSAAVLTRKAAVYSISAALLAQILQENP